MCTVQSERFCREKRCIAVRQAVNRTRRSASESEFAVSKLLRGVAAGYGAKKLGGGCFSTVLIFLVLWWALGHFGVFR
jgi:hypothetical protein